jgi:hypothetical protein
MLKTTALIAVLATLAFSQTAPPGNSGEQLKQYLEQLRQNPGDDGLRSRTIALALTINPKPPTPDAAYEASGKGGFLLENGKEASDFVSGAAAFGQAALLAPWVPDFYFNEGVLLERAERYQEAIKAFRWYVAAAPSGDDRTDVLVRIGRLEAIAEKREQDAGSKPDAQRQVAAAAVPASAPPAAAPPSAAPPAVAPPAAAPAASAPPAAAPPVAPLPAPPAPPPAAAEAERRHVETEPAETPAEGLGSLSGEYEAYACSYIDLTKGGPTQLDRGCNETELKGGHWSKIGNYKLSAQRGQIVLSDTGGAFVTYVGVPTGPNLPDMRWERFWPPVRIETLINRRGGADAFGRVSPDGNRVLLSNDRPIDDRDYNPRMRYHYWDLRRREPGH